MSHLWRATEPKPAVYLPGTSTTGNTNQSRVLYLRSPETGKFCGTIGQLDPTGRADYHGMLLTLQRRLKDGFSLPTNWTLSKCMSDPRTTELTGPTIADPNNKELECSYCDSDRRHVVNLSLLCTTPKLSGMLRTLFGNWQVAPIVRWQSGNRSSVTLAVDLRG